MQQGRKVLLVGSSGVNQEFASTALGSHSERVVSVSAVAAAIAEMDRSPDISLVLCDVTFGDCDGFEVLDHIAGLPEPRPTVIMLADILCTDDRRRAAAADAGYLVKPFSVQRVLEFWLGNDPAKRRGSRRVAIKGTSRIVSPGPHDRGFLVWDICNISTTGAFINTGARLEVGAIFDIVMELENGKVLVELEVEVVRVQEPTWTYAGGCAVRFLAMDDESEAVLAAAIEAAG
jgi:CheY-like chemotaxis protein